MDVAALTDQDYVDQFEQFWNGWQLEKARFPSIIDWWEVGKCHVRDLTRQCCIDWANRRRRRRMELQRTLLSCHARLSSEPVYANSALRGHLREILNRGRAASSRQLGHSRSESSLPASVVWPWRKIGRFLLSLGTSATKGHPADGAR